MLAALRAPTAARARAPRAVRTTRRPAAAPCSPPPSALFDERGYDAATIRDIGERADVDPALIARYFGGKEGLYVATLAQEGGRTLPADPADALATMLSTSDRRGIGPVPHAMVSPTMTDAMREQIMEVVRKRAVEPLAAELARRGVGDADVRAELLFAMALGISLTRASGTLPLLANAPLERLLDIVGPLAAAVADGG